MITRIELTNFMAHKHTVIEPAAGLTVLVGPNNVGKSAVVAALQILCYNDNSTYVLRHGERECSVKVETDDGHVVEWRRKSAPSYVVDSQAFDRLRGNGLPDEVHQALRLPRAEADSDPGFDVHFGTQKSPIFLLASSPATAARFFAASSDLARFVELQQRHKQRLADARRTKNELESKSKELNSELEMLEPVVEVEPRLKAIESDYKELIALVARLQAAKKHQAAMLAQAAVLAACAAHVEAMSALSVPPELAPIAVLEEHIAEVGSAESTLERAHVRAGLMKSLSAPPPLTDADSLETLADRIESAKIQLSAASGRSESLRLVEPPPVLADELAFRRLIQFLAGAAAKSRQLEDLFATLTAVEPPVERTHPEQAIADEMGKIIVELESAEAEVRSRQEAFDAIDRECATAANDLRSGVAGRSCPVCGLAIDADRIVAYSAGLLEGHGHD